ncbi:hypothetical protein M0R04_11070 [Candidatus Dojkabacteria bacterium]|jgi:hypothetical protein|nr:hypothetical protein [Candidatus Dojkabacteria bacterium]
MKNSELHLLISMYFMGLSFVVEKLSTRISLLLLGVIWFIGFFLSAKRELKQLEREIELLERLLKRGVK